jgi:hypothetical protein
MGGGIVAALLFITLHEMGYILQDEPIMRIKPKIDSSLIQPKGDSILLNPKIESLVETKKYNIKVPDILEDPFFLFNSIHLFDIIVFCFILFFFSTIILFIILKKR